MNVEFCKNPGKSLMQVFVENDEDYKRQRMPEVGSRKIASDGREFVFVSTAVDASAGQVLSSAANTVEIADGFTAALSGTYELTVTNAALSAVTAGQFAGGVIVITAGTQQTAYSIKSNTAAATNAVTFTLAEALCADVAATDDCIICASRYDLTVIGTATSDGVGVAMQPSTAGTSGLKNYLWVQTKGVGGAIVGTASALTKGVKFILGAAGVIEAQSGAGVQKEFGHVVAVAAVSDGDATAVRMCFE